MKEISKEKKTEPEMFMTEPHVDMRHPQIQIISVIYD
uniref:Uncharacterized protein n=1 Tax=Arundo donax TaxID=35708 RepID=A0A0A8XR71_ARUDO